MNTDNPVLMGQGFPFAKVLRVLPFIVTYMDMYITIVTYDRMVKAIFYAVKKCLTKAMPTIFDLHF